MYFLQPCRDIVQRLAVVHTHFIAKTGGFLLMYAEPYQQAAVRKALADMPEVTFGFENQGSRLIFYRP